MYAISKDDGVALISASLESMLHMGTIVIGIFSTIFLFYTNSFLIKRRKKELGLYNVLGLAKKHIAKIMLYENIFISTISLSLGLIGGIILNKLMLLILFKLLNFKVPFGFSISVHSIIVTLILFICIFVLTFISNLIQIIMVNTINLLKGNQYGEKEPKTKCIISIIGLVALSWGYKIALTVQTPLAAINLFFIAVILVMIGTYAIFTSGSILLLKLLRKNKKFYYRTKNFISVSSMMYRMKQNAVGLASICILSTAVLVMLSSTVSLYTGLEDILAHKYPKEVFIDASDIDKEKVEEINKILINELKENKISITNMVNYLYNDMTCEKENDKFILSDKQYYDYNTNYIITIPISEYNRIEGKDIILKNDETIIYSLDSMYNRENITINNTTFKIKEELNSLKFVSEGNTNILDTYVLILNDNIIDFATNASNNYKISFDVDGSNNDILKISNRLYTSFKKENLSVSVENITEGRKLLLELNGGLLFLGIFLGFLFLMATVVIIYYKQISEGYDDKKRFEVMKKVGLGKKEIKKIIKNQILMVFFLPLIFTIIHIAFAFPIITKLLAILYLTNIPLFIVSTIITIIIFTIIYGIVYSLTARTYYKIVN
jgi:putative ABC transport system permease protein